MKFLDRDGWRPGTTAFFRRVVAVTLVLVLAALASYILLHWRSQRERLPELVEIVPPKVDEKEKIHYIEYRGGREKIEFRADRNFIGEDGNYRLVGNVKITDFGKKGGREVVIAGNEVVYDQERVRFRFVGRVTVTYEEMELETEGLEYDRKEEAFRSDKAVRLTSSSIRGEAQSLSYSQGKEELELSGGVRFRWKSEEEAPLTVTGTHFFFNRSSRKGRLEGGVVLVRGRSRCTADDLDFELFYETDDFKVLFFRGNFSATLRGEFRETLGASGSDSLSRMGRDINLTADEAKLRAFINTTILHSYESGGKSSAVFISSSGDRTRIDAETLDFIFAQNGELREFRAVTGVRMVRRKQDTGETLRIEGEAMRMQGPSGILQVAGMGGRETRASFAGNEITAEELRFDLEAEELSGENSKAIFSSSGNGAEAGFFSGEKPVFATARWVRYAGNEKRFSFSENVRMWQEKTLLFGKEVEYAEATGELSCTGDVRALFPRRTKEDGREKIIEVSAGRMRFLPDLKKVVYEDKAELRTEKVSVRARVLEVLVGDEAGRAERMVALNDVSIFMGGREGRGERADYDLDKELVVLTGNPVLVEKDRGTVEGRKLTFHLGDGTIAVENQEKERSVTIIKS